MTTYSIGEVSKQTGLSVDTLRYYERIELVVDIERATSGHRCYSEHDVHWLNLLLCLRDTGMPIADMLRFAELVRGGDHTKPDRIELLETHRRTVLAKIDDLRQKLTVVDGKISKYSEQVAER